MTPQMKRLKEQLKIRQMRLNGHFDESPQTPPKKSKIKTRKKYSEPLAGLGEIQARDYHKKNTENEQLVDLKQSKIEDLKYLILPTIARKY